METGEWRVERVRGIPHGAKVIIDAPEGEVGIVWVNEEVSTGDVSTPLTEYPPEPAC
ncbi:hypothetical protein [Streptomyces sp. NPDC046821]|uniref:hypothetical protein n=1 Tax=Streptomyces sp. NPDC046821 TaxID=3154702 RepID=UPI0033DFE696